MDTVLIALAFVGFLMEAFNITIKGWHPGWIGLALIALVML